MFRIIAVFVLIICHVNFCAADNLREIATKSYRNQPNQEHHAKMHDMLDVHHQEFLETVEYNVALPIINPSNHDYIFNVLWDFYNATLGHQWHRSDNWLSNKSFSEWYGLYVDKTDESIITGIILSANNLGGTLPASLGKLTNLTNIQIPFNSIEGTLPSEWYTLSKMYQQVIYNNKLHGTIPEIWKNMTAMKFFIGYDNAFTGTLPHYIGSHWQLQFLVAYNNKFNGTIPAGLQYCNFMIVLFINSNQLTGTIPAFFGNQAQPPLKIYPGPPALPPWNGGYPILSIFVVDHNKFHGTLPSSIGNMNSLQFIYIHNNLLTGTISNSIYNLPLLTGMYIGNMGDKAIGNTFIGKLPSSLCNSTTLMFFDISNLENICYPQCLASKIQLITSNRCQDESDIGLCSLSKSGNVLNTLNRKTPPIVLPYSTPGFDQHEPYGANIQIYHTVHVNGVLGYSIEFDCSSWILFPYDLILFCATENCGDGAFATYTGSAFSTSSYNDTFDPSFRQLPYPGCMFMGQLVPPLVINTPKFTISFGTSPFNAKPHGTDGWPYRATGYKFAPGFAMKITTLNNIVGWDCIAPPLPYQMPNLNSFLTLYDLDLNHSYAVNLCSPWTGVVCISNEIGILDLSYTGLRGSMPSSLGLISTLQQLYLQYNSLTGSIPSSLSNLSPLQILDLTNNLLSNTIPSQLSHLRDVQKISIGYNRFTGTIPESFNLLNKTLKLLDVSNNLIGLNAVFMDTLPALSNATIDISDNPEISCYSPLLDSSILSGHLLVTGVEVCSPTAVPTSYSPTSRPIEPAAPQVNNTPLIAGLVAGVGGFFLIAISLFLLRRRYSSKNIVKRERQRRLRELPVHTAISNNVSNLALSDIINENLNSLYSRDYDNKSAYDLALSYQKDDVVLVELLKLFLPLNPTSKEEVDPNIHAYAWTKTVQHDKYYSVVVAILDAFPHLSYELAMELDENRRTAVSIASPLCQAEIKERSYFMRRYEIINVGKPEHKSATSMVYIAIDHKHSSNATMSTSTSASGKVISVVKRAIKVMSVKDQYNREVEVRKNKDFDTSFVIGILDHFSIDDNSMYATEVIKWGFDGYGYCIIMEAGEKDLETVILREDIAGKDIIAIRSLARDLALALNSLHNCNYIHGDIKPMNVMRIDNHLKLIDLDASRMIGTTYADTKFSSAYLPPELSRIVPESRKILYPNADDEGTDIDTSLSVKDEARSIIASYSHDAWSYGVLLYKLLSGGLFFACNNADNVLVQDLPKLVFYSEEFKVEFLSNISDRNGRNLVSQLLMNDPTKRPTMKSVLHHPFISGTQASRLFGEEAEYDCFISYRVRADATHAEMVYNSLVEQGLRVWWDRACLQPGVSWEDGFCDGLIKSSIFIPIISRHAINHPTIESQNFRMLKDTSPCDNVLLEYQLSLDLKQRGI